MKYVMPAIVGIMLIGLTGCAAKGTNPQMTVSQDLPSGSPTMDYMYRSPPPAVAARLAASPR